MFVYIVVNRINLKFYIGKTKEFNLTRYWSNQKYRIFKQTGETSKPHLYNAVRKYGWEPFSIYPLRSDFVSEEEYFTWEKTIIEALRAQDPAVGYNICAGGRGTLGWRPTAETKVKMGASKKGKPGHLQSLETREKIGTASRLRAAIGEYFSPEVRARISAANIGKKLSPEHCTKISQGRKGKYTGPRPAWIGAKISAAKKGIASSSSGANIKDLSGQCFENLKVLSRSGSSRGGQALWLCRCQCGKELVVFGNNLRRGHTKSCGCVKKTAVLC